MANDLRYEELVEYLCRQFGIEELTPTMTRQLTSFIQKRHYTCYGIKATVEYCLKVLEPPVELKIRYGLGFVPFHYQETKEFFSKRRKVMRQLATIDRETVGTKRVVSINEADRERARKLASERMVDMNALGGYDHDTDD